MIMVIFLTLLLVIQTSSQYAQSQNANCLWPEEMTANGENFRLSASKEELEIAYLSQTSSESLCMTKVDVPSYTSYNFPLYYEVELSTQNTVMKDCIEGYGPGEYLSIYPYTLSLRGNKIQTCLAHLDRIIVQMPQVIAFRSDLMPTTGFNISFTKVSSPCLADNIEATSDHKFLFSPLYDLFYSRRSISCKVSVKVPYGNVLFLQIRKNPSPTLRQCNGSLVVSGASSPGQELCGAGLEVMVLEPRNYADGIAFNFDRMGDRYFYGFQLEYWAIKRVVADCTNQSTIPLPVSSEVASFELQVHLGTDEGSYCDFRLDANGKTLSFPYLSDVASDLRVIFETAGVSVPKGCGLFGPKYIRVPPKTDVNIRIGNFCQRRYYHNSLRSVIITAVAEDSGSFPKVFYAANDRDSYIWIPKEFTNKPELLTFGIRAEKDNACFKLQKDFGLRTPLSSFTNLFAGPGNAYFDFSQDCSGKAHKETTFYSNTSSTVTVQIKRDINRSFWLSFQVETAEHCPLMETSLDDGDEAAGSLVPPNQEKWRENTQCKWIIHASQDNVLKFRSQNHNPADVVLKVINTASSLPYPVLPPSVPSPWQYATSDIQVFVEVSGSLTEQDSFDFQYERVDFPECASEPKRLFADTAPTYLESLGYPHGYSVLSRCSWIIRSSLDILEIYVTDIHLEEDAGCQFEYIEIFDGQTTDARRLAKLCRLHEGNTLYHSTSSVVLIYFHSNSFQSVGGFQLTYQSKRRNVSTECASEPKRLFANIALTYLESPGYPHGYSDLSRCSWIIRSSLDILEIYVTDIHLEGHPTCEFDYLEIFDGQTRDARRLAKLCRLHEGNTLYHSTSSVVLIYFHPDSVNSVGGFQLTYQSKSQNNSTECASEPKRLFADTAPTYLESPGYPHGYSDLSRCSWVIRSSLDILEIYVTDIHLEGHPTCEFDYIEIFDGQTRDARKLAKLCRPHERNTLYHSTSSVVLIYFHSDYVNGGGGFQLTFQSKTRDASTGDDDDRSANYSQTGAIVGGNFAAVVAISSLIIGYLCIMQRRRRQLLRHHQRNSPCRSSQRRRSLTRSGIETDSNTTRHHSSVFVINPLIVNTDGRRSLSIDPPPYPGLRNEVLSHDSDSAYSVLETPPDYCEVANAYQSIQPPAYSDTGTGPASNSDDHPASSGIAEAPLALNDARDPEELDMNHNSGEEYVELYDAPPEYELARQIQDEPPPAYESSPGMLHQARHLGPL